MTGPAIPAPALGYGTESWPSNTPGVVPTAPAQPCWPQAAAAQPAPPASADLFAAFPELANAPPARVALQLQLAVSSVRYEFWQDRWFNAVLLYAAHYVALGAGTYANAAGVQPGAGSGAVVGVVGSKSVGGVSVGYSTGVGSVPDSGSFDSTIYGRQYMTMLQSAAAVVQL